jgi:hypothetical protein
MTNRPSEPSRLMKLWRQSSAGDEFENDDNNVKYASTSKPNQSGFYCSLPPGSRHAAKAQEICATMHSGRSMSKETQPFAVTQDSEPHRLLKGVSAQEEDARDSRKGGWISPNGQSQRRTQPQAAKAHHNDPPQAPQVVAPAPPVAYKYENGQQVAYFSQNGNGELYVSAPKGTGEAELFNDVAFMMTSGGTVSTWVSC